MMSRNFGVTSPPAIGGNRPAGSHGGKLNAPHNLILFPSRSTLEPIEVSEPSFHKRAAICDAIAGAVTGVGLMFALFVLLFVRLD